MLLRHLRFLLPLALLVLTVAPVSAQTVGSCDDPYGSTAPLCSTAGGGFYPRDLAQYAYGRTGYQAGYQASFDPNFGYGQPYSADYGSDGGAANGYGLANYPDASAPLVAPTPAGTYCRESSIYWRYAAGC